MVVQDISGGHDHAEPGHDTCSPAYLSFLTLQRGNALGDALRQGAEALKTGRFSARSGVPIRSMGTIDVPGLKAPALP
ncbi:DUF1534 domain-containing protein [Pseudomonas syringae]|nr:DUF1534 domain-containing protein [Pseudomonas syringae]MCF5740488.1 DUF1534 domain-containing protein [Pseudomonas syringae]MCF5749447.1 DUF1534 domain-containing protein [Pseudomonas syringae]MCF5753324.1 DUF1534 domain-containing protein [Pseudomonas syringae]